ncbi:CHAD domain-containing protein [Acidobacteriota bacterium]
MKNLQFYTTDLKDVRALRREIGKHYSNRSESIPLVTQVLYDTFDWRLFRKNLTLIREENYLSLTDAETLGPSSKMPWRKKSHPKFWWQFPDGPLKDALKPLLDVRALVTLTTIQRKRRTLSILNEDEKAVIKLHHDHIHFKDESRRGHNIHTLMLQPIRGYRKDLQNFQQFLKKRGLVESDESVYLRVLKANGKMPGDYTSKFILDLTPDLPSDQATRMILRYLIDIMKSNERGIKADLDTEFLHDFRVSSRRIRSALSQIRCVFPKEKSDQFRKDFSTLGKTTNKLRDFDVYLLKKEEYRALLPQHTVAGLDPFFKDLSEARGTEFKNVKKFLNSATYRRLISSWEEFLDSDIAFSVEDAKNAQRPVLELAQRFIFRRYKQIIRDGKKIRDDSPDEELHRLRIDCKKLRYLLEFYASLFPKKTMLRLIEQLKKLQDNLGDYNDLFMQQEYLREYLNQIRKSKADSLSMAAAIGGLITALSQRQQSVRSEFKQRFNTFSANENRDLFTKLFQPKSRGGAKN